MPGINVFKNEVLAAQWDVSATKAAIGTSYVDIYTQTNSSGKPIHIDFTGKSQYRVMLYWNKAGGAGTHQVKVCDFTSPTTIILHNFSNAANGKNDSGIAALPSNCVGRLKMKLMALSSTGADSPIFEGARVYLR